MKKLELLRGKSLELDEFVALFNFHYSDYDNFNMIFSMIDSSNSGRISRDELRKQNEIWGTHCPTISKDFSFRKEISKS